MSYASVITSNTATKKCGEIIITMKKNTKNTYSFSCRYCDTICLQMKKFSLHLEREHGNELEQPSLIKSENTKHDFDEKITVETPLIRDILIEEIKIEDCAYDDIEPLMEEEHFEVGTSYNEKNSLEAFEENIDEKLHKLNKIKDEQPVHVDNLKKDLEKYNFSDQQHLDHTDLSDEEESSSDDDLKKECCANEALIKPIETDIKAEEKELIFAIIEEYYKMPQLWNKKLPARCRSKQKEDALQSITDGLNAKLKLKLKISMVKEKLNFICKQYEKEIERQLYANEPKNNADKNSQLWFYENMGFLKTIIENKLKQKMKKPERKVKPLNDVLLCDLIDIYKNYNSLWDVNHLSYIVTEKRHEIMQSMLDEIKNKMNISLDVYRLEKNLNYIHKSFAKDKLFRMECEVNQEEFQPSCSYFNQCDFLESHQGPFKCADCNEIIKTYNNYRLHKSEHDGSIPFECQECGMGFKKIANYTIHAKRHLRVFKYHCEICGKGYPLSAERDIHMRSHTGAQPYLCSVCGKGFRLAIHYDNHIRRHEERFRYFCHICKKGYNHMTRLKDHVKAHLNIRDCICTVCGKGFTSRKYLIPHKRKHEGKNYSCNICGKSFAQDARLQAHKKYHAKRTANKFITGNV